MTTTATIKVTVDGLVAHLDVEGEGNALLFAKLITALVKQLEEETTIELAKISTQQ